MTDPIEAALDAFYGAPGVGKDAPDEIRADMSRAIAAYEAARWRPISEAPRDGTLIEVVVWVIHKPTGHADWQRNFIKFDEETGKISYDPEYIGWGWEHFSFWRPAAPLPTAPKG